ncbi:MAG TPA: c-type cytochrome [Rhodocyclaceae bacterium]|nr:c-type cytochrome [Rhodocyclaceae bacterium]
MSLKSIGLPIILGLLSLAAGAADAPPPRPAVPGGVAPCESCHGAKGEGKPAVGAPRIAAQPEAYLARQMAAFADGSRKSPVMTPIAKQLDDESRADLAAYYAALAAPINAAAKPGPSAERGRQLAIRGDWSREIQACANCHGPDGIGEPPTYPYVAGQHANYLAAALQAWRDGSRNTDPSGQMPAIAKRLSDEDIDALAAYFSAGTPPGPRAFRMVRGPAKAPPVASTPTRPGVGAAGRPGTPSGQVGTEQGEPTTGGSQGPGGGGATTEPTGR